MGFFTDSPYEYMMLQRPYSSGKAADTQAAFPEGHPCGGCPYGKGSPCIGVCMEELLHRRRGKINVQRTEKGKREPVGQDAESGRDGQNHF